jgi:hypothetical protein
VRSTARYICFVGELFFVTIGMVLLHSCFYARKSGILAETKFCYKRNIFFATLIHYGSKIGF